MRDRLIEYLRTVNDVISEPSLSGSRAGEVDRLVRDITDLCLNLDDDEDVSFATSVLFDEDEDLGILSSLTSPRMAMEKNQTMAKAREHCLQLVAQFAEKVGGPRMAPYTPSLVDRCFAIFVRDSYSTVKAAALAVITTLVGMMTTSGKSRLPENMVTVLVREVQKRGTATVRAKILILLGLLVEKFEDAMKGKMDTMFEFCLEEMEKQLKSKNGPEYALVAALLKCLDSLLTQFDESQPPGAALRLFARHAHLFRPKLLRDCTTLLPWLLKRFTHQNTSVRDGALLALDRFLIQNLMGTFLNILDSVDSPKSEVAIAIRALGRLAAPIVRFSGKDELKRAIGRLVPFGNSALAMIEEGDEMVGHAVTIIGAFADMVVHLDSVDDTLCLFIAQVTGKVVWQFPQLWPKQKLAVYVVLKNLLKALYPKGNIFPIFLNNMVRSSVVRAVDFSPGAEMDVGELPLWPHYVELWSHVLDLEENMQSAANAMSQGSLTAGASLEAHGGDDDGEGGEVTDSASSAEGGGGVVVSEVSNEGLNTKHLSELIYDSIISQTLSLMKELDLDYAVKPPAGAEAEGDSKENTTAGMYMGRKL
ncbi:hypothetical protein CBR_g3294 [Chara braunii]|uniref:DNA-PKcs N-terminal domain-containing protein n=1 Tax=Chara braunii TaxID=69332 RepID=A0A388KFB4_CHABU|nr:hypothetical protein CBR_g3294 [Chara braunii]|eukprot:GBG68754.1 hypothetical protein CBR_g3294 [Chara braunii]